MKYKTEDLKMEKDLLRIVRVSYATDNIPINKREYRITREGPVGRISDWEEFAKENDFKGLLIIEKDGSSRHEMLPSTHILEMNKMENEQKDLLRMLAKMIEDINTEIKKLQTEGPELITQGNIKIEHSKELKRRVEVFKMQYNELENGKNK